MFFQAQYCAVRLAVARIRLGDIFAFIVVKGPGKLFFIAGAYLNGLKQVGIERVCCFVGGNKYANVLLGVSIYFFSGDNIVDMHFCNMLHLLGGVRYMG